MALGTHGTHRRAISLSRKRDFLILASSLVLAAWIIRTGAVAQFVGLSSEVSLAGSFVSGMFYTSLLTSTPAAVALVGLGAQVAAWKIAVIGALGVVCGDVLIFRFIRSTVVQDITRAMCSARVRRLGTTLSKGSFRWIVPVVGGLVLASPLPDELGLLMLGASKISQHYLFPIVYVINVAGIFFLVTAGQAL